MDGRVTRPIGIILGGQLLMRAALVNMGTCDVCHSMLGLRSVGSLDWASVGGNFVRVEANSSLHHCRRLQGLELVNSHWAGAQQPNGIAVLVDGARLRVVLLLIRCGVLSTDT